MTLDGAGGHVVYDPADPWFIEIQRGDVKIPLCIAAGVHGTKDYDAVSEPRLASSSKNQLTFAMKSSRWKELTVTVDVSTDAVEIGAKVRGKGEVDGVSLLEGALPENMVQPNATILMVGHNRRPLRAYSVATPSVHTEIFTPQPDSYPRPKRTRHEDAIVTSACTFGPDVFNTTYSPGIFCFVLGNPQQKWRMSAGVCAALGTNHYHTFKYSGGDVFGFSLAYDGMVQVDGEFVTPKVRLGFSGEDDIAAIKNYVAHLRDKKLVKADPNKKIPAWWSKPIFCGWGQQVAWGRQAERREKLPFDAGPVDTSAEAMASQAAYEKMIAILEKHDIPFGTLVIDAGWSTMKALPTIDTKKWPDLKGFIAAQHRKGRKVLLWMSCWSGNDLPAEYLMDSDANVRGVTDPTKQNFVDALKKQIASLIGPSGVDADGFKLDFTGDIPRGKGYRPAKPLWGTELLHHYVQLINDATKAAKPDAMMMTHCGNPYFSSNTDLLRLNDIFFEKLDVNEFMAFRATVARAACAEWLIDCDNDPFADHDSWLNYLRFQPTIGIPSLYTLTHQSMSGVENPPSDLDEISRLWKKYLKEQVEA